MSCWITLLLLVSVVFPIFRHHQSFVWEAGSGDYGQVTIYLSFRLAAFTSHASPKYFLFHLSHQIFGRMHGALNIDKKDN
jgi:hypothetical protein